MFGKNIRWLAVGEGRAETHAPAHFRHLPPVRFRFTGRIEKTALAGNAPLGIGDGAVLFTPATRWQKHMRMAGRIGTRHDIGHHDERTRLDGRLDGTGIRHGNHRVGRHDPQRLDAAIGHGPEHVHRLQSGFFRNGGRGPEAPHTVAILGIFDGHMGGQHVGQPADLAPAHGVRLAGQRKRPHARPADAAGGKVAIDDRVDLVGAAFRLVDTLTVAGDGFFGAFEQFVKGNQFGNRQAGGFGDLRQAVLVCCLHRCIKTDRVIFHITAIDCRTI